MQTPTKKRLWILYLAGVLAVCAFALPGLLMAENRPIPIHDAFDSHMGILATRHARPADWKDGRLDFLLGGLPVEACAANNPVVSWIFSCLPVLQAFWLNSLLIRLVGFAGCFAFLLRLGAGTAVAWAWATALAFSLLPFYTDVGISVSGVAAVVYVCWVLTETRRPTPAAASGLAFLLLFTFYSSLPNVGIFLLPALAIAIAILTIRWRRAPLWLAIGLVVMAAGYLFANRLLIANMISGEQVWHRSQFAPAPAGFARVLLDAGRLIAFSHYHAHANPFPFIWATIGLALVLSVRRDRAQPGTSPQPAQSTQTERYFFVLALAFLATVCLLYLVLYETTLLNLRTRFASLAAVNLSRWYFFFPFVFYGLLFVSLKRLARTNTKTKVLAFTLLSLQLACNLGHADWIAQPDSQSYARFVSRPLFDQAEQAIGKNRKDFKIACLGFFPSIAHLNNYATVGGYWVLYPLEYKKKFREVIQPELDRSENLRSYFDGWGSRCYLMSAELGKDFYITKSDNVTQIQDLRIDTQALANLGADYLFSAVKVLNASELGLTTIAELQDERAAINLFIYQIPECPPTHLPGKTAQNDPANVNPNCARQDSNLQPSDSKSATLSN